MLNSRFSIPDHVSITEIDQESVILNLDNGQYYGLNHIGTLFLHELQMGKPVAEVVNDIALTFQMAESRVSSDLLALTETLLQQGLITAHADE